MRVPCLGRRTPERFAASFWTLPEQASREQPSKSKILFRTTTGPRRRNDQGNFEFDNVPFNNYHLTATATGIFRAAEQDLTCALACRLDLKFTMTIGAATDQRDGRRDRRRPGRNRSYHAYRRRPRAFRQASARKRLVISSSLVTLASPGVAADSNGLFHGLGDHASNSFSIDGQPITDQQSKVFSNQLPVDAVQSMEVIEGAPPAEYGDKTSLVIVATTRSGLGITQPHGDVTASYGTFGATNGAADLVLRTAKIGETSSPSTAWIPAAFWMGRS